MKFLSTTLCAIATCAMPALAGTIDVTGTGMGTATSEAMPAGDGLVVVHANSVYTGFEGANDGNPMESFTGPCFGSILIKGADVSGGGNCHYTDSDGDMAIMMWKADGMNAAGRTQGDWQLVGGSGKWAEASGGGRFDAGSDDQGAYTNNVTGELTMP